MANDKQRVNVICGAIIFILGAVAGLSMYQNLGRPVIQDAETSGPSENSGLPANHPPIDSVARISSLENLIQANPQNAEYRIQLANIYYDMGEYQKAIAAYEEGLKLQPGDPNVETDLATCYHNIGQHDKALQLIDQILKDHPGFAQALYNKGVVLQAGKNDVKGAIEVWESLLQANPNLPQREELVKKINELKSATR